MCTNVVVKIIVNNTLLSRRSINLETKYKTYKNKLTNIPRSAKKQKLKHRNNHHLFLMPVSEEEVIGVYLFFPIMGK